MSGYRYMRDQQRVEAAIIASMLYEVYDCGTTAEGMSESFQVLHATVKRQLAAASWEPINDLAPDRKRKLAKRILRPHDDCLAPFRENEADAVKLFLMVLFVAKHLNDCEVLLLIEGSSFQAAFIEIIRMLAAEKQRWADVEPSAVKQARKMLDKLKSYGLFTNAPAIAGIEREVDDDDAT
jgi:hypothetical protein